MMRDIGNRPGHYRAFFDPLRDATSWEAARGAYRSIPIAAMIVRGDKDGAYLTKRERDRGLIAKVRMVTVNDAVHVLPLDKPKELQELVAAFVHC